MKKLLAMLIAGAMTFSMVGAILTVSAKDPPKKVRALIDEKGIVFGFEFTDVNNEEFEEIVLSGEIPQDVEFLFFMGCEGFTNLSLLTGFKDLKLLWFGGDYQITDLSPLAKLQDLVALYLWSNPYCDYTPLSQLPNFRGLALGHAQIEDSAELLKLTNLNSLTFVNCEFYDVSLLSQLTNLTELNLEGCQIDDVTFLGELTNLKNLNLKCNNISDITHLAGLTNLEYLNLMYNPISRQQLEELRNTLPDCSIISDYTFIDPTIFDALEILKYLVNLESNVIRESDSILSIDSSKEINPAYLITPESKTNGEPTIFDALEILKSLVGIPSLVGY